MKPQSQSTSHSLERPFTRTAPASHNPNNPQKALIRSGHPHRGGPSLAQGQATGQGPPNIFFAEAFRPDPEAAAGRPIIHTPLMLRSTNPIAGPIANPLA